MIPAEWVAHEREDDGELLGYLAPQPDGLVVPMTLFGLALAPAGSPDEAAAVLDARGLGYLMSAWLLVRDGELPLRVRIAEIGPDRVVVGVDDYNVGIVHSDRIVLDVPTGDALRFA